MKQKTAFRSGYFWKRLLAVVVVVKTVAAWLMPTGVASADDTGTTVSPVNQVQIYETITNGFTHPGVGLTKPVLENMRAQVLAQKEPWYTYFNQMLNSSTASKNVSPAIRAAQIQRHRALMLLIARALIRDL